MIRQRCTLRLASVLCALVACDDDAQQADVDLGTDTAVDAGIDTSADTMSTSLCVLATTTEFRTDGGLSILDGATYQARNDVTAVHADAVIRTVGERVFIVNRQGGDSLQELDPTRGYATVSQRSVGGGSNPWSLAALPDGTAWMPLYNEGTLARVALDPQADIAAGEPFVVPSAGESDGRADVMDVFIVDDVLIAVVQGLDPYPTCTSTGRGRLIALDPETATPVPMFDGEAELDLSACNPTDFALAPDGTLWIGHSGGHRVTGHEEDDGGIERVSLASGTSQGMVATEADFGHRDLIELVVDGEQAWVALADAEFGATVHKVTLEPFSLGPPAWETDQGGVFDLTLADGRLWIADRSILSPGVVVLDAETGAHLAGPIDVGYPPFDLHVYPREGACF